MRVIPTDLPGVVVIEPEIHADGRGVFVEVFHAERFAAHGLPAAFAQDNHSRSARNTLRGMHWQWRRPQAKLVRVTRGEIFDVAVDIRKGSPTFGRWVGVYLSADTFRQTFVPAGFAHGFCVVSDVADVQYKCTDVYDPGGEAGLAWNDPEVGIAWPVTAPVLSSRDAAHGRLSAASAMVPALDAAGRLVWPGEPR